MKSCLIAYTPTFSIGINAHFGITCWMCTDWTFTESIVSPVIHLYLWCIRHASLKLLISSSLIIVWYYGIGVSCRQRLLTVLVWDCSRLILMLWLTHPSQLIFLCFLARPSLYGWHTVAKSAKGCENINTREANRSKSERPPPPPIAVHEFWDGSMRLCYRVNLEQWAICRAG